MPALAEVLAASKPSEWRPLDPANTLYVEFDAGRVVIELTPDFAPGTIANIKTLVRAKYFDGLTFIRAQDNYVAQWGDAEAKRSLGEAKKTLPAEFTRAAQGLALTLLADRRCVCARDGLRPEFPRRARYQIGPRLARALLWHGGCGARQRGGQWQRLGVSTSSSVTRRVTSIATCRWWGAS